MIDDEIQRGLYALLASSPDVTDLLADGAASVTAFALPGLAMPYVLLAAIESVPNGTQTFSGSESRVTLEIYDTTPGGSALRRIMKAVCAIVDAVPVSVDGHRVILQRVAASHSRLENDGQTYRGVLDIRIATEPAE